MDKAITTEVTDPKFWFLAGELNSKFDASIYNSGSTYDTKDKAIKAAAKKVNEGFTGIYVCEAVALVEQYREPVKVTELV